MQPDSIRNRFEGWIHPQAGWIAVLALALGVVNTAYSLVQLARPAAPRLLPPEQVVLIPDRYPSGAVFARVALRMTYVNQGPAQKKVVVLREQLSYAIAGKSYRQHWQSFESFQGRGCSTASTASDDVRPLVLDGEDAASHVTYFAPRSAPREINPYLHFHPWESFVHDAAQGDALELVLRADLLDGRTLVQTCRIVLNVQVREKLRQTCPVTLPCEE